MPLGAFKLNSLAKYEAPAGRTANTVTANGNAQVSTAQSYFGPSSALFDGNGDYLIVANNNLLYWNTQPYTVEYWCRIVGRTSEPFDTPVIIGNTNPSGQENYWSFGPDNSGNLTFYYYNGAAVSVKDTATMALNTWYHCAAVITSNTIKIYLDGVEKASAAISGTPQFSTSYGGLNIGWGNGTTRSYNGYLDEIRISNTARYTAAFRPSTVPFVNDANTLLLLHSNGTNASTTFTDDVGYRSQRGIAAVGNAQISTAQNQFGGSSLLFDGTGDYLTVSNDFDLCEYKGHGGNGYTIDCWVRMNSLTGTSYSNAGSGNRIAPTLIGNMTPGAGYHFWSFGPCSDGTVGFYYYNGGSQSFYTSGVTLTTNTWYHLAFTYSAGVGKIYVDGVERASETLVTDAMYEVTTPFTIGQTQSTGFNGYVDELRVSKTVRYTAAFTPTTIGFGDDNDTVLLIHGDGTNASQTITDDNSSGNYTFVATAQRPMSITARGNAQVSTAQNKFGGASALFDGTGDYLFVDSSQHLNFRNYNFTIEFQVRFSSTSTAILFDPRSANLQGPNPVIYWTSSTIRYYNNSSDRITSSSLSLNTWYHVAVSRSGTSTRMFINGTQAGSTYTDSTDYVIGGRLTIGADSIVAGNTSLNGYIDEVRVSNTARYTANFTAPTAAFTNDANTLLLIHANGTNGSTTFTDDNA